MNVYLVGGAVRERLLRGPDVVPKDLDFAVECESFDHMRQDLHDKYKLRVWQERPQFVSLRGSVKLEPGSFGLPPEVTGKRVDADFTLCRAEAQYHDLRHPSKVTPADLYLDLSRRDFTVNAVAVSESGEMLDPYQGMADAQMRVLRTVGRATDRFEEDPLRMLRAVRFMLNCRLMFESTVHRALNNHDVVSLLDTLPSDRVREELSKVRNNHALLQVLYVQYPLLSEILALKFPRLWFKPTLEAKP